MKLKVMLLFKRLELKMRKNKSKSIQDKKCYCECHKPRAIEGQGIMTKYTHDNCCVEQSKEEQCECSHCHDSDYVGSCPSWYKDCCPHCQPKTEDTGECICPRGIAGAVCAVNHMGNPCPGYPDKNPNCPIHGKASGVSTSDVKEDSHDTLSAPLNKDWSDRFKELFQPEGTALKYINVNNFVVVEEIIKFISQEIESARASERKKTIEEMRANTLRFIDSYEDVEGKSQGLSNLRNTILLAKDELLSKIEE